jgi:subtilisin family serine protease
VLAGAALLLVLSAAACSGLARDAPLPGATPQVMVTLPPGPPPVWERHAREIAVAHGLYLYRAWTMRSLGVPCIVYGVAPGERIERVIRRLAADPRVESAQPVQRFEVLAAAAPAGDPYGHLQHATAVLRAGAAHRWSTGRGVRVAVIDTGVDVTHPDLAERIVEAANFVDRGGRTFTRDVHGTAIAGVLAAVAGNGIGIAGVAPEADLLVLKACVPRGAATLEAICDSYSLAQAVDAAIVFGVRVINLSLSGPEDALLSRLLAHGLDGGITVVAAADPRRDDLGFPASLAGVIAVRAEESALEQTVNARRATIPGEPPSDVLTAPGTDVLTTVPGGGYDFLSGNSLAAAQVTGVVALLLERAPGLTPAEVAERLRSSRAAPPEATVVDACLAVARLVGLPEACAAGAAVTR